MMWIGDGEGRGKSFGLKENSREETGSFLAMENANRLLGKHILFVN